MITGKTKGLVKTNDSSNKQNTTNNPKPLTQFLILPSKLPNNTSLVRKTQTPKQKKLKLTNKAQFSQKTHL